MTDAMDLKILGKLQKDCTQSLDLLSDSVGLSSTSCYRRIRRLEWLIADPARHTEVDHARTAEAR